ncbi:MAG: NYN domain-containing protein [Candidatus Omnitrophica bacterium]|nr:NYN domain-containing protein [Candidatus Omnitrophota bacterium]
MRVAILVDGAFFLSRYKKIFNNGDKHSPKEVAKNLYTMAHKHVDGCYLYRIFYYDCEPYTKKLHTPILKRAVDFSKTDICLFRLEFLNELKRLRKVALRLGYLNDDHIFPWKIYPDKLKQLVNRNIRIEDLTDDDFTPNVRQKGVDMKIGLDIASLAYKKQVEKIILISADGDFVSAAKLARREGIDFVLDPMWQNVPDGLFEHIDGLKSTCERPVVKII